VDARLLILSRLPFADLQNKPVAQVRLNGLSREAAVDFLTKRGVRGLERELRARAGDYNYHPLSLNNLAAAVTDDFGTDGDIRKAPRFEAGVPMDRRRRHVLQVAFNKRGAHLRELLSRLAAVREVISPDLANLLSSEIHKVRDNTSVGRDLFELARHGLLNKQDDGSGYTLHPLVREYAYARLSNKRAIHDQLAKHYTVRPIIIGDSRVDRAWLNAAKQCFHHTARSGRYEDAYLFFYNAAHSSHIGENDGRDLNHIVFYELGKYNDYLALLSEFFPAGTSSLSSLKKEYQPFLLNDLALAHISTGDLKVAKGLATRGPKIAIELVRSATPYFGQWALGNKAMGLCLESLGQVNIRLGDLNEAERNLQRSIECYSNLELAAHLRASQTLLTQYYKCIPYPFRVLALLLIYSGAWHEAEDFYGPIRENLTTLGSKDYFYDILWAMAALHDNDISAADQNLRSAETAFKNLGPTLQYQHWRFELKYMRGQISSARTELQDAENQFGAALEESRLSGDLEQESRALLALARVAFARASRHASHDADLVSLTSHARDLATQAQVLAARCGYALVLSDIHLFFAELTAKLGDPTTSRQHALRAKTLASCGRRPLHKKSRYYRLVYDQAQRLLRSLQRK